MTIKTKDMLNSQRDTSFETPFLTQYIIQAWGRQCETPTLTLNLYVDFETFTSTLTLLSSLKTNYMYRYTDY